MSKNVDAHDLYKDDTFRTAFLTEAVDFVCEKKPHTLIIRDLEYAKIVRCKDCKWFHFYKTAIWCEKEEGLNHPKYDSFCSYGEREEDGQRDVN